MAARDIALNTAFSFVLAANVIGNSMVLLVLAKDKSLVKSEMRWLMSNLAIADVMVGVFFVPALLPLPWSAHPTGMAGDWLCKLVTGKNLAWLASLVSAFTLVLVAVERYHAIVHPLEVERRITKRKATLSIACCWVLAALFTLPSFVTDRFVEEGQSCKEGFPLSWQNVSYNTLWLMVGALVPMALMTVLYSVIFHSLRSKNRASQVSATHRASAVTKKTVTKMMFSVSLIYILCCFPTHILYYVYIFHPELFPEEDLTFRVSYILLVLNSTINPLVYCFLVKRFRKQLKKMLCRCSCERSLDWPVNSSEHSLPRRITLTAGFMRSRETVLWRSKQSSHRTAAVAYLNKRLGPKLFPGFQQISTPK